jgi:hypothetical protein
MSRVITKESEETLLSQLPVRKAQSNVKKPSVSLLLNGCCYGHCQNSCC